MKNAKTGYYFSRENHKVIKKISIFILIVFTLNFYILPSAYSVTLEEQALRKSAEKPAAADDDFNRKTPTRRDFQRGETGKDPRLACLLSLLIPGGGEIYLKNDLKGIFFFLLPIAGYALASYYFYTTYKDDVSKTEKKSKFIISGLLGLVAVILHIVGMVESYNDAIEINEKSFYYGAGKSKNPYIAQLQIE